MLTTRLQATFCSIRMPDGKRLSLSLFELNLSIPIESRFARFDCRFVSCLFFRARAENTRPVLFPSQWLCRPSTPLFFSSLGASVTPLFGGVEGVEGVEDVEGVEQKNSSI